MRYHQRDRKRAVGQLIDSFKRLEYRGYNTASIAVLADGRNVGATTLVTTEWPLKIAERWISSIVSLTCSDRIVLDRNSHG